VSWVDALLLGILEGLTEFLPVSSTGHLILLAELLGKHDEAGKTLDIVIQLGAVLAVVVFYRARLGALVRGVLRREAAELRLALALLLGFLPAAVVGLALHRLIKERLFGPGPVAGALIAGGVLMIAVEVFRRRRGPAAGEERDPGLSGLEHVTPRRALLIGLAQCASLWPGASRSMATIVGGQLTGLSTATAAEFSFLLAVPTLGAATLFDLAKNGRHLLEAPGGAMSLAVGLVVAFVVALLVIAAFLRYLRRFGMAPFGVYRIALGALVLLVVTSH
jgi:undecaprenyl-diphosphatase